MTKNSQHNYVFEIVKWCWKAFGMQIIILSQEISGTEGLKSLGLHTILYVSYSELSKQSAF